MSIQLRAVEIVAASIPTSLDFYRLLDVPVPDRVEGPHAEAELPGGVKLLWDTEELIGSIEPGWQRATGGQPIKLAFDCGTPDGVDQTYAAITGAGHRGAAEPWDADWGQRYAVVIDPDGNHVDLYAALT